MRSKDKDPEKILQSLGIEEPEHIDLPSICYHFGADVRYGKVEGCEARIIGINDKAIITVNEDSPEERQRFSIGHEFGHWILHKKNGFACEKSDLRETDESHLEHPEAQANIFSSRLLMPKYIFQRYLDWEPTFKNLESLSKIFKVSLTASALRFVSLTKQKCALIFSRNGQRFWFQKSASFYGFVREEIHYDSGAMEVSFQKKRLIEQTVNGYVWFDHPSQSHLKIQEVSWQSYDNSCLSMIYNIR